MAFAVLLTPFGGTASIPLVSRMKNLWGLLIVIAALIVLYSQLPLSSAIQFGEDERYQLMPAFLCSKGFKLYQDIWSDQPPLFVLLLAWAFEIWGPSVLVARLIAAGFGLLLFGAFFQLVRERSSHWTAFLATLFLLASPAALLLSISVMQEVPAYASALFSVWLLFQWAKRPQVAWLAASGAVLGVALEIKFTAALVIPAMLVEIALCRKTSAGRDWRRKALISATQWTAVAGVVFAAIGFLWGRGSFQSSYRAHFAEHAIAGLPRPEDLSFPVSILFDHAECVIAALVGIGFAAQQRRLRQFAFPIVMLLTAAAVHWRHRPWWMYYYLHLAIPLAWLAGFGVSEAIQVVSGLLSAKGRRAASKQMWKGIALCGLLALALNQSLRRLESSIMDLQARPRISTSPVLAKMGEYADRTHWIFATDGSYPFHARLPVPPELAVVTPKRYWSDQITSAEIESVCVHYQVEQILLECSKTSRLSNDFLNAGYKPVYQDTQCVLYTAKRLESK